MKNFGPEQFERVQAINPVEWKKEAVSQEELFIALHDTLPKEFLFEKELLVSRLLRLRGCEEPLGQRGSQIIRRRRL